MRSGLRNGKLTAFILRSLLSQLLSTYFLISSFLSSSPVSFLLQLSCYRSWIQRMTNQSPRGGQGTAIPLSQLI
ncbi:hypothetical protein DFH29DRAFT_908003 [Suillus ampliporus]|nr:hypothetical protein DFH29DRAFT_908003 [Suillus ampliporus]